MLYRIVPAEAESGLVVRLTYADGAVVRFDVAPLIRQGGVYQHLADPAVFARVSVGERGRFIEWPGEIDFCADALCLDAEARSKLDVTDGVAPGQTARPEG